LAISQIAAITICDLIPVSMKLTGHKTRSVFERYNIVSDGDLESAARKLSSMESQRAERLS
jgi:hypothetical protein